MPELGLAIHTYHTGRIGEVTYNQDGDYRPCPRCNSILGIVRHYDYNTGRRVRLYACCYTWCFHHNHMVVKKDDHFCVCCGECLDSPNCWCVDCGCGRRSYRFCFQCNGCQVSCCECVRCPACNAIADNLCETCGYCINDIGYGQCCRCVFCDECEQLSNENCYECNRCPTCCHCGRVMSYHYIPPYIPFYGDNDCITVPSYGGYPEAPDGQNYLGLEIETEAVRCHTGEIAGIWKESGLGTPKSDGSLNNGVECITHPHTFTALRTNQLPVYLEQMYEAGARAWDTGTCGLHIHVSRKAFRGKSHQWRFARAVTAMETQLVRLSGRRSDEWASWSCASKPTKIIAGKTDSYTRYVAVNVENKNTIELRFWRGSLKPMTVMGAAAVTDSLVEYTRYMSLREVQHISWDNFCRWVCNALPDRWEYINPLAAARRVPVPEPLEVAA